MIVNLKNWLTVLNYNFSKNNNIVAACQDIAATQQFGVDSRWSPSGPACW
jgi:hypothetical protein